MNSSTHASLRAIPSAQPSSMQPSRLGLGIAEHEDLVWLTSRATGAVVFTGTASELRANTELMAACSPAQRAEISLLPSTRLQ